MGHSMPVLHLHHAGQNGQQNANDDASDFVALQRQTGQDVARGHMQEAATRKNEQQRQRLGVQFAAQAEHEVR